MLAALILPVLLTGDAPSDAVKLNEPRVQNRPDQASATRGAWVDANGWRILRDPGRTFVYHVKGQAAALAAAESFTYGTAALISADAPGSEAFARMLDFLKTAPAPDLPPVADIGVIDDGSDAAGELMNLLTRMNLLYKIEKAPDRAFHLNVRIGTKEYPKEDNPNILAHKVRSDLGDDSRSLRVYGSEVVIARFLSGSNRARVFLINYANRPALGLRVRIRGAYAKSALRAFGLPDAQIADLSQDGPATEFTIPELRSFAVVDLSR
jgi:hypothetical protein